MKFLNVTWLIVAVTIIGLGGIALTTGAPSLLVQLANATTDVTNTTMGAKGVEEGATTDITTTTNNVSNAALGRLFSFGEGTEANVNPINETYIVISYLGNRIIMPPNTTGVVINTIETGNVTINIQPNGLSINQGQAVIMTEDSGAAAEEEENATITFVLLSRTNPDGSGSGTGVAFFSTNSTGQLAFLDNMVAIGQTEFSPEGSSFREWEWKGADIPFGDEGDDGGTTTTTPEEPSLMNTSMTNATTAADTNETAATPEEEGEGNEEGEDPNEFEECVVPPGMDPGDVGC
jgi:hypothetical protein